VIKASAAQQHG